MDDGSTLRATYVNPNLPEEGTSYSDLDISGLYVQPCSADIPTIVTEDVPSESAPQGPYVTKSERKARRAKGKIARKARKRNRK